MIKKKVVLSIAGTIFLGALGSGLWSLAQSPLGKIGNWLLSVATLGISTARDSLYADAAKGNHEVPSLLLLSFFGVFMLIIPIAAVAMPYLGARLDRQLARIRSERELSPENKSIYEEKIRNKIRQLMYAALFSILSSSFLFIQILMVEEQNTVSTLFVQYLKIVGPDISSAERIQFESNFALMSSKSDFNRIMSQLRSIGQSHHHIMPPLDTW